MSIEELAKILDDRLHARISDDEAVRRLVELGDSEAGARDRLQFQDELFGEDQIEVLPDGHQ